MLGYKFHFGAQISRRGYFIQGGGINFLKGYKFPKGILKSLYTKNETSHKKVFRMKTSACRDGTLKNQPNKMGTTPQHIYTIRTSCAILQTIYMLCVC